MEGDANAEKESERGWDLIDLGVICDYSEKWTKESNCTGFGSWDVRGRGNELTSSHGALHLRIDLTCYRKGSSRNVFTLEARILIRVLRRKFQWDLYRPQIAWAPQLTPTSMTQTQTQIPETQSRPPPPQETDPRQRVSPPAAQRRVRTHVPPSPAPRVPLPARRLTPFLSLFTSPPAPAPAPEPAPAAAPTPEPEPEPQHALLVAAPAPRPVAAPGVGAAVPRLVPVRWH
ncbi:hypothetical protein JB92DRAFT_352537 [Gautieria morchelliformis]|nr:hypothetical protein JB92DRAFT_352537 [Gautieria morchelliformis]